MIERNDTVTSALLDTADSESAQRVQSGDSRSSSRTSTVAIRPLSTEPSDQNATQTPKLSQPAQRSPLKRFFYSLKNSHDLTRYKLDGRQSQLGAGNITAREYRRRWQRGRILINSTSRLLFTAVLCTCCAVVLFVFKSKGELRTTDTTWFQTYLTGLPLLIALNYRSSLQSYVKILRWRILATWNWRLRHFDLILNAASSKSVLRLLWSTRSRCHGRAQSGRQVPSGTHIACLAWLLVNLVGAIGIALLSLTYALDPYDAQLVKPGDSDPMLANLVRPGTISMLNLNDDRFYKQARLYAVESVDESKVPKVRPDFVGLEPEDRYECSDPRVECWRYSLNDTLAWNGEKAPTIRSIISMVGCAEGSDVDDIQDGVLRFNLQGETRRIYLDDEYPLKDAATLYYYNGTRFREPLYGDSAVSRFKTIARSNIIAADMWLNESSHEPAPNVAWEEELTPKRAFSCVSTIFMSAISSKTKEPEGLVREAFISERAAEMLSASIALYPDVGNWFRMLGFNETDPWSAGFNRDMHRPATTAEVANVIARFTMTAVAAADQIREVQAGESSPMMKSHRITIDTLRGTFLLNIQWGYAIAILVGVPALQLAVLLIVIFFANDIVVLDDSYLNTGRLLAPVIEKLGKEGSLLSVDEVAELLEDKVLKLRYGWKSDEVCMRVTVFEEGEKASASSKFEKFPEGVYN